MTRQKGIPSCSCGALCWKQDCEYNPKEPCWGQISVSEDYPGEYTHYCEGHGHYDDKQAYKCKEE